MKLIITTLAIIALAGCQSPYRDISNNDFIGITPEPVRQGMAGAWTGSMGPSLVTMEWEPDGTGRMCYSMSTAETVQRMKFSGGEVFLQGGTRLKVESITEDFMMVRSPYFGSDEYKMYEDDDLSKASPYCAESLGG